MPLVPFYTPWKYQTTFIFLFRGVLKATINMQWVNVCLKSTKNTKLMCYLLFLCLSFRLWMHTCTVGSVLIRKYIVHWETLCETHCSLLKFHTWRNWTLISISIKPQSCCLYIFMPCHILSQKLKHGSF